MKKVKIIARLVKTWLGGSVVTPSACLKRERTITIRTKDVVIIRILGASDNIVNQIRICIPFVKSCGVFAGCIPIFIFGNDIAQNDGKAPSAIIPIASIIFFNIPNFILSPQIRAHIPYVILSYGEKNCQFFKKVYIGVNKREYTNKCRSLQKSPETQYNN